MNSRDFWVSSNMMTKHKHDGPQNLMDVILLGKKLWGIHRMLQNLGHHGRNFSYFWNSYEIQVDKGIELRDKGRLDDTRITQIPF